MDYDDLDHYFEPESVDEVWMNDMMVELSIMSEYTAEGLKNFLTGKGFSVTVTPSRHLPWLGKFSAVRR